MDKLKEQRAKHGFFTMPDGSKSTDPKNSKLVKKATKSANKDDPDEEP